MTASSAITSYGAACTSSNGGTSGSASGAASPLVVGTLTNGKSYTCTVTATNTNGAGPGTSPASAAVVPSTTPSAPAQPTVSLRQRADTVAAFTAPGDGGNAITSYTANCVSSNGGTAGSASGATSPIVVGTLTNGKSYTCTVTATNTNGAGRPRLPPRW